MGKKAKVGKQRKDKFYHLAKETGYRSRAAFKLIQLNRKFEFLQQSKVLVDLCAAPGGWMQVAVEHMPVASVIIGVDLFPIKPVAGCIGIQEDITNPRCLALLKKELKTWKADVVLNDGAPNVGQNWIHDAYQQSCLTLSAFKLATELLRPGGYFITKLFRSKDYNALIWLLQQFFKNVFSTKPAASRLESAEIFVVCKGYLAPTTIDPKFLDAKYVFEDVEMPENKKQLQHLLTEIGKKKKAEGYPTGENLLYRPVNASEFVRSENHIELLANTSQLILDEEWIEKNSKTTPEIVEYCKDVKVLGRKEIKSLITWRKVLSDKLAQFSKLKNEKNIEEVTVTEVEEESDAETKLDELQSIADEIKGNELKEAKRKRKKMLRDRKKIIEKTSLDMIIPGDVGPTDTSEDSLFTLRSIKTRNDVENLTVKPAMPEVETEELDDVEELELFEEKRRQKFVKFNKGEEILDSSGRYYKKIDSEGEDSGRETESEEDPDLEEGLGINENEGDLEDENFDIDEVAPIASHPLITDLDYRDKNQKRLKKAQMWFDKDVFQDIEEDVDEDIELNKLAESFVKKGAQVLGYEPEEIFKKVLQSTKSETERVQKPMKQKRDDLKVVKSGEPKKKKQKLDIEGLALATVMVHSRKSKRDLKDEGWNRYAFADPGLPVWFLDDEKKHMKKALPVPAELVDEYKNNLKEINARPIKKVVEAKARKKKRAIRKLEKTKKRAEAILEKGDMTDTEKANQLKQLYKKATMTKKKEVTYIVAKKFNSGKRVNRPAGLKGPYKVVDPRMKKDLRKMKTATKGKGKGKGAGMKKGGGGGRGGKSGKGRGR